MKVQDENKIHTENILDYFGKAYLKMPRIVLDWLYVKNKSEQILGRLYFTLFIHCYYADGVVKIKGQEFECCMGEFISTYRELSRLAKMSLRSVRDYVKVLINRSLIEVKTVSDRTRFIVCGYRQYMEANARPEKNTAKKRQPNTNEAARMRTEAERRISRGHVSRTDLLDS